MKKHSLIKRIGTGLVVDWLPIVLIIIGIVQGRAISGYIYALAVFFFILGFAFPGLAKVVITLLAAFQGGGKSSSSEKPSSKAIATVVLKNGSFYVYDANGKTISSKFVKDGERLIGYTSDSFSVQTKDQIRVYDANCRQISSQFYHG